MMGLFLNRNIDTDNDQVGVQKAMGEYVYKFWHLLDETLNYTFSPNIISFLISLKKLYPCYPR